MPSASKHKLIIVESPAKARAISRFLGNSYKVEASQGHVCDLPKSQIGVDIENDFEPKYITIRGRGDILAKIRKEAKNASKVYLATDPDREGEAISWHLAHALSIPEDAVCRVEFHEVTKNAVKNAVKSPRQIKLDLVDAQQARRVLDRLVGYKISPLLWAKISRGLSAGRVQSVATRMVVSREEEIEAFIPEEYWDISANAQVKGSKTKTGFKVRVTAVGDRKLPLANGDEAQEAVKRLEKAALSVANIRTGEKRKSPAAPFTTSSLQQEAGRKLNFSTAKTMQVVQQLYEGIDLAGEGTQGLVTYIRTDSVRISDEAMTALREYIPAHYGAELLSETPHIYKGRSNAQDAHEAIRPTSVLRTPEQIKDSLSKDQYNLYRLIYLRFVASQMKQALYETLTADIEGDGLQLRFYGEHKVFPGFTTIYEESTDDADAITAESRFPQIKVGDPIALTGITPEQHFTQPPPRYTEASLVRAMEEKGIGRPSTYAPTISTIMNRGYVVKEKKRLIPTDLGRMVNALMEKYFPDIVDLDFTADMENQLDEIEEGKRPWKEVLRDFYPKFEADLSVAESEIEKVEIGDEPSDIPCDKCGAMMVYKNGRFGKFLACPNFPECRNTKPVVSYLEAPCPKCGGRLMEKMSRKSGRRFFGCERFPDCDFVSWDEPVSDRCEKCGGYMVKKYGRKGETWHVCANETCRNRVEVAGAERGDTDEDADE